VAEVHDGQALLERDTALGRIDQRLRDAIAGGGSLLVVEGPAGIGKTRLVLEAERHGRELGLTTLSARGAELERDFAYGLVRQLFEAPLVAASPPERAELLAGAAGHAARLFGVAAAQEDVADALLDPSFAILHGLYWLSANLARRTPLLLCVDDVHWADQASLRFLHYLGRRLQELPIAVVAAARPARSANGSPLLAALAADPSAEILELAPLSQRAVAELLRLSFGTEVEQDFAVACHEVTGGVPFLLRELIRAVAGQGIEPTAAASSRVAGLAPRAVSHSVVRRLSGLSAPARLEYARAVADLGAALRRAGHRAESREVLRVALDLAHTCGAITLTERARTELVAAGGRPRRLVLSGLDSLTPSERRVAQLAAGGLSNRDIAQNLFITTRTVEGHLTHAYQKLAITSREQLSAALTP
jgi:DNA-binding CsgD family transcriptional regulator